MIATDGSADGPLREALAEQQRLGVLGTSVEDAIAHSEQYLPWLQPNGHVLDLGSGAGVPGLVIAVRRPDLSLVLLDARERRTDQLRRLAGRLRLQQVAVVCDIAERASRPSSPLAGAFDAVVARAFGTPGEVLGAAQGFLRPGGVLIVSEPPAGEYGNGDRWETPLGDHLWYERLPVESSRLFVARRRST